MNKSTKIWLNYVLGGIISVVLLWAIYLQVMKQVDTLGKGPLWQTGRPVFLWLCVLLMPVNLALEAWKWHILAGSAQQLSYKKAFASYLAGIAFSIVTPNRIGEYPGRILYLKRKNTFRLISVSVLGGMAQMFSLFLFGLMGLLYYNPFPGTIGTLILISSAIATIFVGVVYWRFETWLPLLQKIKWLHPLVLVCNEYLTGQRFQREYKYKKCPFLSNFLLGKQKKVHTTRTDNIVR